MVSGVQKIVNLKSKFSQEDQKQACFANKDLEHLNKENLDLDDFHNPEFYSTRYVHFFIMYDYRQHIRPQTAKIFSNEKLSSCPNFEIKEIGLMMHRHEKVLLQATARNLGSHSVANYVIH